nr:hypothetical protein BaRGS_005342 [Batillaria attramentaria]
MATVEQETADLQQRIADLEAALAEQEQDTIKAAQFGKSLLEQNEDLKIRIDDPHEAACCCTGGGDTTHGPGATHKVLERELRGRISELESLLQSHLDRTQVHSTSASFDSEEMATIQQELMTAKMDITELQAKNIDLSGKLQQMQCERDTMANRLAAASTEIEELQCQIMSYVSHLEQSRKESTELRAQLDAARVEGQGHSSKGNSLFSETEDLEVEKKMASLKVNNQQLKEKYEIEKQQNQKYKMQIAMALQMAGHKQDDAAVQRLRNQLNEAHAEIRALSEQMQKLEAAKDSVLCAGDDTTFYDDKENFCDSTMDSTFALLHGRKVSMSDNVKVVEADGEETVKTLTDEGDRAVKPEVAKKKKEPKTVRNLGSVFM